MSSYGLQDRWPEHPKSWWRETLELARSSGWRLEPRSDHAWGVIACPQTCSIPIFSSGTGGESVAKSARRKIARCTHAVDSPIALVIKHLDAAERLTDAAEALLDRRECQARVEEMLAHADDALTAAQQDELMARIDDLPDEDDEDVDVILGDARGRVDAAKSQFSGLPSEVAKPHRARARDLRARIDHLRCVASTLSNVHQLPSNRS